MNHPSVRRALAKIFTRIGRWLGLALIITAVSPIFPGQVKPKIDDPQVVKTQKPIRHEVGITLKLIQVVVTDGYGKPVTDLKKEDFVLLDNGEKKKLTEFERHDFRVPAVEAKPAEGIAEKTSPAAKPGPPSRKFFLLFDFANNGLSGVRKMGEVAKHFLDTAILPGDQVAVLTLTALKLLQVPIDLTTDHGPIRKYVAKIGLSDSSKRAEDLEDEYQRQLKAGGFGGRSARGPVCAKAPGAPFRRYRRDGQTFLYDLCRLP